MHHMIFSCPEDHEPGWQSRIFLGMVEGRSVKCEEHTHTHTYIIIIDSPVGGSMRVAYNDHGDRAGLHGYVQFNKYTRTHTHTYTRIAPRR